MAHRVIRAIKAQAFKDHRATRESPVLKDFKALVFKVGRGFRVYRARRAGKALVFKGHREPTQDRKVIRVDKAGRATKAPVAT